MKNVIYKEEIHLIYKEKFETATKVKLVTNI